LLSFNTDLKSASTKYIAILQYWFDKWFYEIYCYPSILIW